MIYPLSNAIITQYFGEHPEDYQQFGYPGHNGIDLITDDSPPIVYAFSGGRVLKVGWQEDGYGKYIVDQLGTRQFYYCHLEEVYIKPGDQVSEGEPIAKMGNTGNTTGPHLHFGIRCTDREGMLATQQGYQGFMDPIQLLQRSQQPQIAMILPGYPAKSNNPLVIDSITIAHPHTHGKRTMYPRMKYF